MTGFEFNLKPGILAAVDEPQLTAELNSAVAAWTADRQRNALALADEHLNQLRDELHRVLGESVDNLFATGDALEKVAWSYETTDGNNSHGLREAVEADLGRNRDNTDKGEDPAIWTDEERQKQIKDKMDIPPKE